MSAPNVPNDFKALVSTPASSMCSNFVNTLLKLPMLIYNFMNWLLDSNGNFTKGGVNQVEPPGTLQFAACVLPEDGTRLLCDGRQVSQTTYADLYAAIGATFGSASAGMFKLPDWRGMAVVGIGSGTDTNGVVGTFSLGVKYGEYKHTILDVESGIANHTHPLNQRGDLTGGGSAKAFCMPVDGGLTGGTTQNADANASQPMNVTQPSLGAYVYIRC